MQVFNSTIHSSNFIVLFYFLLYLFNYNIDFSGLPLDLKLPSPKIMLKSSTNHSTSNQWNILLLLTLVRKWTLHLQQYWTILSRRRYPFTDRNRSLRLSCQLRMTFTSWNTIHPKYNRSRRGRRRPRLRRYLLKSK